MMTVFTVGDVALVAFNLLIAFSSSNSRFNLQTEEKCISFFQNNLSFLFNPSPAEPSYTLHLQTE